MDRGEARISARHDLSPEQIDRLEDLLYAFNASRTGLRDAAQLAFVAEFGDEMIGAVAGYTWGGFCELRQVWVHEDHRRHGLGRLLMTEAIEEARTRGCTSVFLATFDFQAPQFYARLGFRPVAEIADKPAGHSDILMRLALGKPNSG